MKKKNMVLALLLSVTLVLGFSALPIMASPAQELSPLDFIGTVSTPMGAAEAKITLAPDNTYIGKVSAAFGSVQFTSGTWAYGDESYVFTDSEGEVFASALNESGKQEINGVWDVGSMANTEITLVAEKAEAAGADNTQDTELPDDEPLGEPSDVITLTSGDIAGVLSSDNEIAIFKGIPYAAAPVGDLRWKDPQPVEPWDGVLNCGKFGNNPIQYRVMNRVGFDAEFNIDTRIPASEDSLTLNIWKVNEPTTGLMPVIVFIHGGGSVNGGSSCPIYDGESIARNGVVFVSINYRLGVLGFLAHPELSAESEYGVSGNYALKKDTSCQGSFLTSLFLEK